MHTDLTLIRFLNNISGAIETEEPPQFRGGVVADPMGLGKTLTMIALAATDVEQGQHAVVPTENGMGNLIHINATLIIIPPPRELLSIPSA